MSRLMLPFALLISHLLLINHTTAARNIDGWAYSTRSLRSINTIERTASDSSPVRFTAYTGYHTVQVIIPTKTVCRQKINTFFIVGGSDELELLLKTPSRLSSNPGFCNFTSIAAITTYLSRWATSFLSY